MGSIRAARIAPWATGCLGAANSLGEVNVPRAVGILRAVGVPRAAGVLRAVDVLRAASSMVVVTVKCERVACPMPTAPQPLGRRSQRKNLRRARPRASSLLVWTRTLTSVTMTTRDTATL